MTKLEKAVKQRKERQAVQAASWQYARMVEAGACFRVAQRLKRAGFTIRDTGGTSVRFSGADVDWFGRISHTDNGPGFTFGHDIFGAKVLVQISNCNTKEIDRGIAQLLKHIAED